MASPQCLTANPDISGIGVRVAVYIQAILNLVPPFVAGWDGKIDDQELEDLIERYSSSQVLGITLLISAVVQAKTFGLSFYYGNIILLLSWINVTSTLVFIPFRFGAKWSTTDSASLNLCQLFYKVTRPASTKDYLAFFNIGDEMIIMSAFGLWLWVTFPNFGTEQECIPYTHLVIFKSIPMTSRILRPCLIALYSLNVVMLGPVLWITVAATIPPLLLAFLSKVVRLIRHRDCNTRDTVNGGSTPAHHNLFNKHPRAYFFSVVGVTFAIQVLLIFFTEFTIKTNRPLLKTGPQEPKENEWTFGQTLALMQTAWAKYEDVSKVALRIFRPDGTPSGSSAAGENSTATGENSTAAGGLQTTTGQDARRSNDPGTQA